MVIVMIAVNDNYRAVAVVATVMAVMDHTAGSPQESQRTNENLGDESGHRIESLKFKGNWVSKPVFKSLVEGGRN